MVCSTKINQPGLNASYHQSDNGLAYDHPSTSLLGAKMDRQETRKRNQSTNRCSTASLRIPIRALDSDLVRPHQALLLLVLDRFQQTLEIDFEELRRVCCLGGSIRFRKAIGKLEHFQYLIEICGFVEINLALYHTCCNMDSQTIQRMAVLEAENELMELEYNEDEDSQEEEHDLSVNEPAQSTHTQQQRVFEETQESRDLENVG
ncbi:hypothetical protein DY000_02013743 [Brassica cretica]|uniref:Uncharacterized protein n=1 Tax=Brassica cretica TaxID=69181 RepID=A0ABQ7CM44_BRACR|nr:hypothetical protein DY000_02013743 [Brassica cretica]